ncbi:MAG: hypothetical protein ACK5AY_03335 [Bacteroidota bacterium]|jgi:hypothetical protein
MNFLIPILYTVIFSWIVFKSDFFSKSGIPSWLRIFVFYFKIITGIFVIYVYTNHYGNVKTADVLLYYSDGKIISESFYSKPLDFFKLISGWGCDTEYFHANYFSKMDRWQRHHDSFFYNDCHTIIRFDALVQILSFGAFHAGTVIICFISFSGLTAIYRSMERFLTGKKYLLFGIVFFSPALLFWGSSLFKEGLLIFGIGFLVFAIFEFKYQTSFKWSLLFYFLMGLSMCIAVKIYVLLLLIPPVLSYLIIDRFKIPFKSISMLLFNSIFIFSGLFFLNIFFQRNPVKEVIRHQHDFINIARGGVYLYRDSTAVRLAYNDKNRLINTQKKDTVKIMKGSTYETWNNNTLSDTLIINNSTDTSLFWNQASIEPARSAYFMPHLKYSFSSFAYYLPNALFNVLLRPFIWEAENLYQKICSIENIIYLLFFALCIFLADFSKLNTSLFWVGLIFSLNLFLLIGFTTPVAGALVRYKMPAVPFFLFSALFLLDVEKAKKYRVIKWFFQD